MKVLLVANINSTHTKKWATALKQRGLQVGLFSLNQAKTQDDWYKHLDFFYYPKKEKKLLPLKYSRAYLDLKKVISQFKPHILHSHFATNHSFLANLCAFKPHVVTTWGSDVFSFPKKNRFNRWLLEYNLKKATAVISTSRVMAKELKKYSNKDIQVIPFGIDFSPYNWREEMNHGEKKTFRIGSFKKVEHIYGTDILLRAFALLKMKLPGFQLKLDIVGDGSMLANMKDMAVQLGIEKDVDFCGWVEADKVPELLKRMDICVYLSRHESFGVSLLEAMAAGIPLVVTRCPGFIEVVEDPENAILVDIESPEQSADSLVELITNSALYIRIRYKAHEHVKKKYDLNDNIDLQIAFYEKIINRT